MGKKEILQKLKNKILEADSLLVSSPEIPELPNPDIEKVKDSQDKIKEALKKIKASLLLIEVLEKELL